MKLWTSAVLAAVATALACSGSGSVKTGPEPVQPAAPSVHTEPTAAAPVAPPVKQGPVHERALALREAADQLDKAQTALDNGNRNLADQLFSGAELLVGVDSLASIAPQFRDGAPPRITTPTTKIDVATAIAAPQPKVAGNSEAEDEKDHIAPPRVEASLTGTMQIDGHAASGAFGLITLEPVDGKWRPRTPKHLTMQQLNRVFLPHVMAISVGSTVSFPNLDSVFHNVFSTSPVAPFDLGLYKQGEARDYTFQREGIVRLGCNLHANMSAYIAVVSAPAYVVTDDAGNFSFRRMAPGRYKLRAWSERSNAPITQDIALKPGKNEVTLGVTGDAPPGPQPDKFGGKRG